MTISTGDILGHSQVGVYLSVVGNNLFYPASLDKPVIEEIAQVFDIEMNPLLIMILIYMIYIILQIYQLLMLTYSLYFLFIK